ncbi:D-alanyl-D-alanine-carboxypeptidase/endopeptidaseAmpH [Neolewinella maritima]|uniref:D-alanyl-D-alanine-carboxypeptidase/endopeptidase AmpH n=2 Tax=Neolewinella maritima TaxID=1383882 RepID=A0ABN8F5Z2_9BACT|nr:D-alanyl-D-alanine-carboxypeptidase/endopeptidaseAmpH [Neolewinella maritima]
MTTHGQSDTVTNALQSTALDSQQLQLVHALVSQYAPDGEAAIALLDGEHTHYLGARREAGRVVTVDNHDRAFAIGSISKVFTATLLANMVEDGRLRLTDRVETAYDFPFADSSSFTYQQLANHTAGLPRLPSNIGLTFIDPYHDYTPDKLEAYLRNELTLDAQGQSAYSNLGAGLLAYTLTHKLDSTTYAAALREYIFDPLGMDRSSDGPDSTRADLVQGYTIDGSQPAYWHFTDAMAGAGGIVSTPADMVRFLRAQCDTTDRILALTRTPTVELQGPQAVGLGWQILQPEPGRTVYWHNGAVGGYRAFAAVDVENALGVVVLTNVLLMGQEVDATGMQLLRSLGK